MLNDVVLEHFPNLSLDIFFEVVGVSVRFSKNLFFIGGENFMFDSVNVG